MHSVIYRQHLHVVLHIVDKSFHRYNRMTFLSHTYTYANIHIHIHIYNYMIFILSLCLLVGGDLSYLVALYFQPPVNSRLETYNNNTCYNMLPYIYIYVICIYNDMCMATSWTDARIIEFSWARAWRIWYVCMIYMYIYLFRYKYKW
jgi:hypothetical protein